MKPTVINNNSENPHQPQHDQQNVNHNQANNGQPPTDHSRRFPQFRQHGFGFDDPDGDVFADMGLRSRLNRMGNPFDWSARKRRGSGQNLADAHHYFDDVDFPFGSTWDAFGRVGNKRHPAGAADRSGFFDYVPPELRQYVPENFGGYFRDDRQPPHHQQQPQPQPHHQQPQQQQQMPPQQQQSYQPTGSKSNLCDAAIQTDDLGAQNNGKDRREGSSNSGHENRNDGNVNRSSSSASSSSKSTPYGNQVHMSTSADGPGAYAGASAGNNQNQYYQESPNYAHQTPQYGRHYQQPYGQQYQYSQSPQQNQFYAQAPPPPPPQPQPQPQQQQQQPQQQQQQHTLQEGFVRNVPIVLEETGTPVNRSTETSAPPPSKTQTGPTKTRPEPLNKESFASNEPIPCPPPPGSQNQQSQPQHSDNQENADSAQTPHTADCISKIQAIQRDVLELMLAVEQFGGKRGDKDYIYLDEMLTRNLLKLDTIDTNGKESIRLARREAIKCIQTSIAVLEAKSDLHLNEKRDSIDQTNKEQAEGNAGTVTPTPAATEEKPAEKMDLEDTNTEQSATNSDAVTDTNTDIPKIENITIDDKTSNDNDKPSPTQTELETKPDENSATSEKTADTKN